MKNNYVKRLLKIALATTLALGILAGCGSAETKGNEEKTPADSAGAEQNREIVVAVAPGFYPITYADDEGNAQGYDVEVFKALDEILPQYSFRYEVADKETMNVGVQSGTYQVGINSLFKTQARTETYYMPENNMGYTPVGIIQREDHLSGIGSWRYQICIR